MKRTMKMLAAAMLVSAYGLGISGCGGGGGQGAPGAGTVTGRGKLSARVSFEGTSGHARYLSSRQASQTGDVIEVTVVISGVYSVDGKEFEPVTRTIQVDAATGQGTASLTEVPVGKNHLLEATAKFPGGGEETVAGLIQGVSEGKTTEGVASPRTTPAAAALYGEAAASGKRLSDMPYEKYAAYLAYVEALHQDLGLSYGEITSEQVLSYADLTGKPETIAISPEAVTLEVDQQFQFSAVVKDANGKTMTAALEWTADSSVGTITSAGLFTATGAGVGAVSVSTSGGALSAAATVTSELGCEPVCSTNEECSDADALTLDACLNGGTCEAVCENAPIVCNTASDCDDGNALTIDTCSNGGTAAAACTNSEPISCNTDSDCYQAKRGASGMPITPYCLDGGTANSVCIACRTDADCDDADALTLDSCADANLATSACNNTPIACNADADCDDAKQYTEDSCANGGTVNAACQNLEIVCLTETDCDDADALTLDFCNAAGTSASYCDNLAIDCNAPADCDDADPLTLDGCELPGEIDALCVNTPIACNVDADCDDADALTLDSCLNGGMIEAYCDNLAIDCNADADCDDLDPYTQDACLSGGTLDALCENTPLGTCLSDAECDDLDPLTLDVCDAIGTAEAACANLYPSRVQTIDSPTNAYLAMGVLNADGSKLFVSEKSSAGGQAQPWVWVMDTANGTFNMSPISTSLSDIDGGLAADPNRDRIYAIGRSQYNYYTFNVSAIDLTTESEIQVIDLVGSDYYNPQTYSWQYGYLYLQGGSKPAVSQQSDVLYIPARSATYSSGWNYTASVVTVDLQAFSQGQTIDLLSGYGAGSVAVSDDAGLLFAPIHSEYGELDVVDLSNFNVTETLINGCCGAKAAAVDEIQGRVFVRRGYNGAPALEVFDLTGQQAISTIALSSGGYGYGPVAAFPQAGRVFATSGTAVDVVDAASLEVLQTIANDSADGNINDLVVDAAGRKVYVIQNNAVTVIGFKKAYLELAGGQGTVYCGDALSIHVVDPGANQNPILLEPVSVTVVNGVTGETETVEAVETGEDTGTFDAALPTACSSLAGTNDDGTLNADYNHTANGSFLTSGGEVFQATMRFTGGY